MVAIVAILLFDRRVGRRHGSRARPGNRRCGWRSRSVRRVRHGWP